MDLTNNSFVQIITSVFKKGHERTNKAKENILQAIVIKGVSIAISLVLIPLTLNYVNATEYGIWLTLGSIIGWFGFFDIGFGNGLRNKFTEAIANGDHDLARIYVSTTYAILTIIILIVLVLFFCINPFLDWSRILNTPSEMAGELSLLAMIVFVFFCIQFVLSLLNTVLTANQEPAKASLFNLFGSLMSLIVIFILTKTTKGNLVYLGATLGLTPVLVLIISNFWFYNRKYKRYSPSLKLVKFSYARDLMTLGIKFFILQVAALIIYQTSNIIIAQLFGPAQVTPFNIAYKYFSVVTMGFSIIMLPFWSAFTEAWFKKDIVWIKNVMKNLIILWSVMSFGAVIMLIFSNFIYRIWVGEEIVVPLSISIVMAAYVILNSWCVIFSNFLNGVGKVKLQMYSGTIGALINIPLSVFLGKHLGISGVILSTCILAVVSAIWSPIQYTKLINNTAKGIWNR